MESAPFEYHMPENQGAIDKVNQACYDHRASYWDRFPFPNVLPGYVKKYYDASLGNRVLDVGSGTGLLAKFLADEGFDVSCIDPSPEMVRRCRQKGLKIQQCGIQSYQPKGQFAMIFAILSLIHIPKDQFEQQIKKLADAIPKGGMLFLAMLEGNGEGFFEGPDYPRFFSYYTPKEIITKTQTLFIQIDYHYVKSGAGYMLFALQKT